MESLFKEVVSKGKGGLSLDSAVKWLKEAKIIDGAKLTEEKVRSTFASLVSAGQNLDFAKFQEGLGKIAEDSNQPLEELQSKLEGAKAAVLGAAGASGVGKALSGFAKKFTNKF